MKNRESVEKEFLAYAERGGAMPDDLAGRLSEGGDPSHLLEWAGVRHGPERSVEAAEAWAEAAQRAPKPAGRPRRRVWAGGRLAPLSGWLEAWAGAIAGRDQALAARWSALSNRLVPASVELAQALLGAPVPLAEVHEEMGRQMQSAILEAATNQRRGEVEKAGVWMDAAAAAGCPAASARGMDDALRRLIGKPSAWIVASMACARGGKIGPGMEAGARQWVNFALNEHVGSASRRVEAKERVECAQAVLGAMGSSIQSYRGKGGEPFDAMAMGALWAWPTDKLAGELSLAGLVWSAGSKRRAPGLAAGMVKRAEKVSFRSGERALSAALGIVDAVCGQGGMGPFGPDWLALGKAAAGADWGRLGDSDPSASDVAWGAGFARWGRMSGWGPEDWEALAEWAEPLVAASAELSSAIESARLGEQLAEAAPQDGGGAAGRGPKPRL